jgi:asparagine synthase (glutamine-hydrolysing)
MVDALEHRGPDDRGFENHVSESGDVVALGHARLSIIDLGGGRQPISNEDGSVQVVANGEIYNYAELSRSLKQRGHEFRTESDCEVIVHLWEEEGEACVERLRGMFAFVLHDRRRGVLFGARDRFGQKPLFWTRDHDGLAFASEIKSLLRLPWLSPELDVVALDQFLFYQFVPHPRTMLQGVQQLPPAHTILFDGEETRLARYWRPPFAPRTDLSDEQHLARVEESLRDAVASHLVADVPVGVFLSGGIDSSLAAVIGGQVSSDRLQSFSVSFPGERQDETEFARIASRHAGTDHREFPFEPGHLPDRLDALARIFDQPLADPAALPLAYLSEQASKEIKVVFTGDGGDELFGGYEKHRRGANSGGLVPWIDRIAPSIFSASALATCGPDRLRIRKLRSRIAYRHLPIQECVYFKGFWEAWDRHSLYRLPLREQLGDRFESLRERVDAFAGSADLDEVNRLLLADQLGYLPDDLLPKTDFATMAYSIESRAPFLDHELAEVAGSLPPHLKTTANETKVALRRLGDKLLPAELTRRPKHGFAVPLSEWFRGELRDWVRGRLLDSSAATSEYFDKRKIERVLDEHSSGRKNRASKIYTLLFFELWHRHYLS